MATCSSPKAQLEAKYYQPSPSACVARLQCDGGSCCNLSLLSCPSPLLRSPSPSSSARSHLSDRFFFGTPLTMRGFESWSLGPIDHHDTLGGEVTASTALSASVLLPDGLGGSSGARLHAFVNGGNLVGRGVGCEVGGGPTWAGSCGRAVRVSAGCGCGCADAVWSIGVQPCTSVEKSTDLIEPNSCRSDWDCSSCERASARATLSNAAWQQCPQPQSTSSIIQLQLFAITVNRCIAGPLRLCLSLRVLLFVTLRLLSLCCLFYH